MKGLLIAFFLMMFAPAAAYADDSVDVNSIDNCNSDSDSVAESKCKEGKVSSESETITDETASFEGTYDNEEEVLNKKEEKEKEYEEAGYENITSKITECTIEEETGKQIEEYVGSTTETEEDAYVFDTEEEANAKKEELEVDNHDKKVTVTIKKRSVDSGEDEVTTITEQFNSVEEAEAYFNKVTKKAKKYKLTASGKKTVMDELYTLEGTKSKDIMKDEYALDVTTETKLYEYYPETVEKNLYYLTVKADIPKKEKKAKKSKSKAITNPQTGDNILVYAILLTMSAGALTAESICLRKEM